MVKKAHAIFVGGQPGSGKTYFIENYLNNFFPNYECLDLDKYRNKNIVISDPIVYSNITKKEASKTLEKLSNDAINSKKNFIIECSLGTYNDTLINVHNNKHDYYLHIYLSLSTLENSLLRIFERFINESSIRMTDVDKCILKYNEFNNNLKNIVKYSDKIYCFYNNDIVEIKKVDFNNLINIVNDFRSKIYEKEKNNYIDRLIFINKTLSNNKNSNISNNLKKLNCYFHQYIK